MIQSLIKIAEEISETLPDTMAGVLLADVHAPFVEIDMSRDFPAGDFDADSGFAFERVEDLCGLLVLCLHNGDNLRQPLAFVKGKRELFSSFFRSP